MPIESLTKKKNLPATSDFRLIEIKEPGRNLHCHLYAIDPDMQFQILCDGTALKVADNDFYDSATLDDFGYVASTPGISVLEHNAAPLENNVSLTFPFSWETSLVIIAKNVSAASRWALVSIVYETQPRVVPPGDIQQPEVVKDPAM